MLIYFTQRTLSRKVLINLFKLDSRVQEKVLNCCARQVDYFAGKVSLHSQLYDGPRQVVSQLPLEQCHQMGYITPDERRYTQCTTGN